MKLLSVGRSTARLDICNQTPEPWSCSVLVRNGQQNYFQTQARPRPFERAGGRCWWLMGCTRSILSESHFFLGQPVINKTANPNSQPVHSESCWTCFENTGQPAGVHLVWNYITISLIIVLIMIRWFRIYFIFLLLLLTTEPANIRYSGIITQTSVNTNINRRIPKKRITDFDPSRMRVKVILCAKSGLIWRRLCAGWSDWRFRFLQAWRVGEHKRDHGIWFIYLQTDPWEWSFCSLRIVFIEWGSNYYNSLLIAWCYWNAIDVTC